MPVEPGEHRLLRLPLGEIGVRAAVARAVPGSGRKGYKPVQIGLSNSFWRSCPELRGARIGRWLIGRPLRQNRR